MRGTCAETGVLKYAYARAPRRRGKRIKNEGAVKGA